jgi:hypothetical protein
MLVEKSEEKRVFGKRRNRQWDNSEVGLKVIEL